MSSRNFLIALVVAVLAWISPIPASSYTSAPMTFCNKTTRSVNIAYAYHSPGVNDPSDHSILTGPFVSQGWRQIDPQKCTTVSNPFDARYIFWFPTSRAESQSEADDTYNALKEMHDSSSPESFCVNNYFGHDVGPFTYENENASVAACDQVGGSELAMFGKTLWVEAHKVGTWVDPIVNFTGE